MAAVLGEPTRQPRDGSAGGQVILDQDPRELPVDSLKNIQLLETRPDGQKVSESNGTRLRQF